MARFDPAWILFGNRRIIGVATTRSGPSRERSISWCEEVDEVFCQQEDGPITRGVVVPS